MVLGDMLHITNIRHINRRKIINNCSSLFFKYSLYMYKNGSYFLYKECFLTLEGKISIVFNTSFYLFYTRKDTDYVVLSMYYYGQRIHWDRV